MVRFDDTRKTPQLEANSSTFLWSNPSFTVKQQKSPRHSPRAAGFEPHDEVEERDPRSLVVWSPAEIGGRWLHPDHPRELRRFCAATDSATRIYSVRPRGWSAHGGAAPGGGGGAHHQLDAEESGGGAETNGRPSSGSRFGCQTRADVGECRGRNSCNGSSHLQKADSVKVYHTFLPFKNLRTRNYSPFKSFAFCLLSLVYKDRWTDNAMLSKRCQFKGLCRERFNPSKSREQTQNKLLGLWSMSSSVTRHFYD